MIILQVPGTVALIRSMSVLVEPGNMHAEQDVFRLLLPTLQGKSPWSGQCGRWLQGPGSQAPSSAATPDWEARGSQGFSSESFPWRTSIGFLVSHPPSILSKWEVWRHFMGSFLLVSLLFIFNLESHSKFSVSACWFSFGYGWWVTENMRHFYLQLLVCAGTVICVFGLKESLFTI